MKEEGSAIMENDASGDEYEDDLEAEEEAGKSRYIRIVRSVMVGLAC